jgi:hypothetical protein
MTVASTAIHIARGIVGAGNATRAHDGIVPDEVGRACGAYIIYSGSGVCTARPADAGSASIRTTSRPVSPAPGQRAGNLQYEDPVLPGGSGTADDHLPREGMLLPAAKRLSGGNIGRL